MTEKVSGTILQGPRVCLIRDTSWSRFAYRLLFLWPIVRPGTSVVAGRLEIGCSFVQIYDCAPQYVQRTYNSPPVPQRAATLSHTE